MDIEVMSKRDIKDFIEEGFYDKLAVISFYGENEYPITLPDDVKSFIVKADDYDLETLKEEKSAMDSIFPRQTGLRSLFLKHTRGIIR